MKRILCSVSLIALAALPATAGPNGDLWEVTSQMTMEGMPAGMGMPAQTRQVCSAHEWTKPPVANENRECETVNFKTAGNKSSWTVKCSGGMSGEGEVTRNGADAYAGWMKMTMPQGTMTMNLSGKRVGDCDAGEVKAQRDAQVARIQAQAAEGTKAAAGAMVQICSTGAQSLDMRQYHTYESLCTGPQGGITAEKYKSAFCDSLNSYDGFKKVCHRDEADAENTMTSLAGFCGADLTAMKTTNCAEAVKTKDLELVGKCCPVEAQAIAKEHCAGRSYTSAGPDGYGSFCVQFAKDVMDGGANAPPAKQKKVGKSGR